MICLRSSSIAFGGHVLFSGLDLSVGRGQLVGLSGESGCGKTSLLRALLGFVPMQSASAEVMGLPVDAHHIGDIRRRVAYLPQELQPAAATGADLIRLTHGLEHNRRLLIGATPAAAEAADVPLPPISAQLRALGLDPSLLDLPAPKLSGGQRQRLLLAAALSVDKPLLLLDEPSSALDEESTQRVGLALLRACHEEGRAALIVSHDPVLLAFCDRVVSLSAHS